MPGVPRVAPLTSRKVIAAESPLAIVTRHTTERARRSVVIQRLRRGHLKSLRDPSPHTMAIIAIQSFTLVVLRVTEAHAKSRGHFRRTNATARFMTDSARRNLSLARLCARAVTLITGNMRIESRRNAHGYASAARTMTSRTTNASHLSVTCMVESHVEAAEPRELLQRSRLDVAVANCAYRIRRISKLLYMTTSARQVIRVSWHRGPC